MKKVVVLLLCLSLGLFTFMSASAADLIKLGVTYGDLNNPVWADCANTLQAIDEEYGFDVTVVGCKDGGEQITQVENFITSGCKGIIVGAKDTNSMSDYMAGALEKGIVVYGQGYEISNYTATLLVKNYEVGYNIASMAAEWINSHFPDGACEVIINEAPEYDVLVDRVNGMKDALAKLAPNAKIVAYVDGTTTNAILPQAENAFTANPNVKVCISVGDGGALAFREAARGMNLASDDFGIFCVDCTEQVAKAIYDGDLIRGARSLGGGAMHAKIMLSVIQKIFAGEAYDKITPYPETAVSKDNVEQLSADLGYNIK
jgi:ribose transport system substrate-binding protein